MNHSRILLIATITFSVVISPVLADDEQSPFYTKSQSKHSLMNTVKDDITRLIGENVKLEKEYQSLKEQYAELQKQVDQYRKESGLYQKRKQNIQKFVAPPKTYKMKIPSESVNDLNNELLLKKSKSMYLRGELLDLEEREKLWELQLADLQYEHRQLKLELKKYEYDDKTNALELKNEAESLDTQLQRSLEMEAGLQEEIVELEQALYDLPSYVSTAKAELKEVEAKVKHLRKSHKFQLKENELLLDKRELVSKKYESPILAKQNEKELSLKIVESFQEEYDSLDQQVQKTMALQKGKQKLYKEIITLDRENARLRDQISSLEAATKLYK